MTLLEKKAIAVILEKFRLCQESLVQSIESSNVDKVNYGFDLIIKENEDIEEWLQALVEQKEIPD